MDIKDLESQINAVAGRLQQVEGSTLYTEMERGKLIDQYTKELQDLNHKKDEISSPEKLQTTENKGE